MLRASSILFSYFAFVSAWSCWVNHFMRETKWAQNHQTFKISIYFRMGFQKNYIQETFKSQKILKLVLDLLEDVGLIEGGLSLASRGIRPVTDDVDDVRNALRTIENGGCRGSRRSGWDRMRFQSVRNDQGFAWKSVVETMKLFFLFRSGFLDFFGALKIVKLRPWGSLKIVCLLFHNLYLHLKSSML